MILVALVVSYEEAVAAMAQRSDSTHRPTLTDEQRKAIGTWSWLGWRNSTPAFKASLALLGAVAFALIAYWLVVVRG
jgi:hypothetical protein